MELSEVDLNQLTVSNDDELQLVDDELSLDEMIDVNCYCFDEGQIIGDKPSHYIIKPYTFEKARENNLLLLHTTFLKMNLFDLLRIYYLHL